MSTILKSEEGSIKGGMVPPSLILSDTDLDVLIATERAQEAEMASHLEEQEQLLLESWLRDQEDYENYISQIVCTHI